jgi:septation ring formation regulator EzrA
MKPNESGNSTPSQVGVLVEELNQRFDLLADGQSDLNRQFGLLSEGQNRLRKTVEGVRVNQARTLESITQIRFDITTINGRLERLESARA